MIIWYNQNKIIRENKNAQNKISHFGNLFGKLF